jgi:hypothetical protein
MTKSLLFNQLLPTLPFKNDKAKIKIKPDELTQNNYVLLPSPVSFSTGTPQLERQAYILL